MKPATSSWLQTDMLKNSLEFWGIVLQNFAFYTQGLGKYTRREQMGTQKD
jgi:hypothetical protein